MYHVVEFVNARKNKLKSIDVVPTAWVKNEKCLWPPWKNSKLVQAAIVSSSMPDSSWTAHKIRIIRSYRKFYQQKVHVIVY